MARKSIEKLFVDAARRALQRVTRSAEVAVNREIRKQFKLRRSDVDAMLKSFTIKQQLIGKVVARGARLGIIKFNPRQTKTGVRVSIKRGQSKFIRSAFKAKMQSGHIGIFRRVGEKRIMDQGKYTGKLRQPIEEVKTIAVAEMAAAKDVRRIIERVILERWKKEFTHELQYRLSKL